MTRFRMIMCLVTAVAALGWFAGEAKALFLIQVSSTLNVPAGGDTTVGGSSVLIKSVTDSPSDVDLSIGGTPLHQTYGSTTATSTSTGADAFSIPYQWTLTFSHVASAGGPAIGTSVTLSGVSGTITGSLTKNGSTLTNVYTGNPSQTTPVTIMVDGQAISVKLDAYTPPGTPPSSVNDFSVSLASVPEPTTIALMGVGGLVMLAPYLRRKTRMVG